MHSNLYLYMCVCVYVCLYIYETCAFATSLFPVMLDDGNFTGSAAVTRTRHGFIHYRYVKRVHVCA